MDHSRCGMIHSFSERFKTRKRSFVAASSLGKWPLSRHLLQGSSGSVRAEAPQTAGDRDVPIEGGRCHGKFPLPDTLGPTEPPEPTGVTNPP